MIHARIAIARDQKTGKRATDPSTLPKLYLFETLAMEHGKALAQYVPRPYGGDVALFRASKQLRGLEGGAYLGWKPFFHGRVELCEVPGHQQNLMLEPNVRQLASAITVQLKAAEQRYGGADEERSCSSDRGNSGPNAEESVFAA
jgi:thioesterase domain-containing protein